MSLTTPNAPRAWAPDTYMFEPADAIPEALILELTRRGGTIEGDDPLLRVPYLRDAVAHEVAEGAIIPEETPELGEILIASHKIAIIVPASNEMMRQHDEAAAQEYAASAARSVIAKADHDLLNRAAPTLGTGVDALRGLGSTGLLNNTDIVNVGQLIEDVLDPIVTAIALVESHGGNVSHFVMHPTSWAFLLNMLSLNGGAVTLLGVGATEAPPPRRLYGVPVITSNAMPDAEILAIDKNAIISAVGPVRVDKSDQHYFNKDTAAIRVTFRLGWGITRPDRLMRLRIKPPTTP